VRAYQVDLQLADLIANDVHIAQLADASRDRVRDFLIGNERVNDSASAVDGLAGIGIKKHRPPRLHARNFTHRLQSKIIPVNVQCLQSYSWLPVPFSFFNFPASRP
jgi:hypothetical protein